MHLFAMSGFPKLVLRTVQGNGRFTHNQWIALMRERLDLFREGDFMKLWELLQADQACRPGAAINAAGGKRKTTEEPSVDDHTVRRVRTLVGEGAPRKALDALVSKGTHDPRDPRV